MKKQIGKKCWINLDNILWRSVGAILLLAGIFAAANINIAAQTSPCDYLPYSAVTRTSVTLSTPQTNDQIGYSGFEIARNGGKSFSIYVTNLNQQFPANTIFKGYLNGVEVGTLTPRTSSITGQLFEWNWFLFEDVPIVGVGDTMEIKKNGQPFLSGAFTRNQYDYEELYGFAETGGNFPYNCSRVGGAIAFPDSSTPRMFYMGAGSRVFATEPITKISLHEPSQQPGIPGTEILTIPFQLTNPTSGWYRANGTGWERGVLTQNQFNLLRQGLLTVIAFTANHPNGYSQMPLTTNAVNAGGDFEGDGIADLAVFRPSEQNWYVQRSSDNQVQTINFGRANDKLVVGDYDSDNKADITAFQTDNPNYPGKGVWQILRSSDNSLRTIQWGLPGDIPLAIDSDRNNTSDLGIFRPLNGTWYIQRMGDIIKPLAEEFGGPTELVIRWGTNGDKPLVGDFNNDNVDELIAFRPSEGNWYIYNFVTGNYQIEHWGLNGDIPVARDFDGDGKVDLTVYRPSTGTWYIRSSLDNSIIIRRFGLSEDIPVAADFDKDGVADIAVFRPSNGTWYVTRSSDNSFFAAQFGLNGDIPAFAQR